MRFSAGCETGTGFAGMHSASDTYHEAPGYLDMLGNEFRTHGDQATVDAIVENTSHPAAAPLGSRFRVFDEIYMFTKPNRGSVTMLLSLDRHPADGFARGRPAWRPAARLGEDVRPGPCLLHRARPSRGCLGESALSAAHPRRHSVVLRR